MARTYTQAGAVLDYTNAGAVAIAAGSEVVIGDCVGIALVDIAALGGTGSVAIEGVHEITKVAGNAWNLGDSVDWDAAAGAWDIGIVPAPGDVTMCAVAAADALAADTTAYVKLTPGTGTGA